MIEGRETGRNVRLGECEEGSLGVKIGGLEGLGDVIEGLTDTWIGAPHVW